MGPDRPIFIKDVAGCLWIVGECIAVAATQVIIVKCFACQLPQCIVLIQVIDRSSICIGPGQGIVCTQSLFNKNMLLNKNGEQGNEIKWVDGGVVNEGGT